MLTFLHDQDRNIRGTIDNSSVSAILISAAMRYTIADKYDVPDLKDAAWNLIELTFALIRAGAESFDSNWPCNSEVVVRNLSEGFFLATDLNVDNFRSDTEQGIVDFLEYITRAPSSIPEGFQILVGKELHRTIRNGKGPVGSKVPPGSGINPTQAVVVTLLKTLPNPPIGPSL
jgi:hypothetical protein